MLSVPPLALVWAVFGVFIMRLVIVVLLISRVLFVNFVRILVVQSVRM